MSCPVNPQSDGKVAQTVDRAVHSSYSDSQEDNCLSDIRQSLRRVLQKQILELDGMSAISIFKAVSSDGVLWNGVNKVSLNWNIFSQLSKYFEGQLSLWDLMKLMWLAVYQPNSSVLAWRIPGTEKHGGLPPMGSHRVGHDRSDLAAAAVYQKEHGIRIFLEVTRSQISCEAWDKSHPLYTCYA